MIIVCRSHLALHERNQTGDDDYAEPSVSTGTLRITHDQETPRKSTDAETGLEQDAWAAGAEGDTETVQSGA